MNFLTKIRDTFASDDSTNVPASASFATRPDTVNAPVSGLLVSVEEINDEVISSGMLGVGYGIVPATHVIYAPCDGRIDAAPVTNHAIGLMTPEGVEVLIHVGIDTVKMNGKSFTRFVELNDEVKAGQPLLKFSRTAIANAGFEDMITIVVSNPHTVQHVDLVGSSNTLIENRPLVKIGDPLMVVKH